MNLYHSVFDTNVIDEGKSGAAALTNALGSVWRKLGGSNVFDKGSLVLSTNATTTPTASASNSLGLTYFESLQNTIEYPMDLNLIRSEGYVNPDYANFVRNVILVLEYFILFTLLVEAGKEDISSVLSQRQMGGSPQALLGTNVAAPLVS